MKNFSLFILLAFVVNFSWAQTQKAPAYPLITHDPYFSIWSTTDNLAASPTKHWTGADQPLLGVIKVDGKFYRFMGDKSKIYKTIVPASDETNYITAYTETAPAADWMQAGFNDASWQKGMAPFGDNESISKTKWVSENLWVRRSFTIHTNSLENTYLKLQHDDDVQVYINGHEVYNVKGWTGKFIYIPLQDAASYVKQGKNIIAIHVTNTAGGSWLDAGIVQEPQDLPDAGIALATQNSVQVTATQTAYSFTAGGVNMDVTFTSPLLMNDLDLLSRPVTYIGYKVKSNDEKAHAVQVFFGASTNIAVNIPSQEVTAKKYAYGPLSILKAGSKAQPVLQKKGDDLRIDWGYMHVSVPVAYHAKQYITAAENAVVSFKKIIHLRMFQPAEI